MSLSDSQISNIFDILNNEAIEQDSNRLKETKNNFPNTKIKCNGQRILFKPEKIVEKTNKLSPFLKKDYPYIHKICDYILIYKSGTIIFELKSNFYKADKRQLKNAEALVKFLENIFNSTFNENIDLCSELKFVIICDQVPKRNPATMFGIKLFGYKCGKELKFS